MSIPAVPGPSSQPPPFSLTPSPQNQPEEAQDNRLKKIDPTGMWTKFLSTPGNPATADDVKRFLDTLLQTLNNQIRRDMKHAKEAAEKIRRAAEGRND